MTHGGHFNNIITLARGKRPKIKEAKRKRKKKGEKRRRKKNEIIYETIPGWLWAMAHRQYLTD
jgi:hypothetical protein